MSDAERVQTKTALLDRIDRGWARLDGLVSRLSAAQLTTPDATTGWTLKDHLSHLTAWEAGIAALLRHAPRYPAMGFDLATVQQLSMDELNERIVARDRDLPLDTVLARWRQTHADLLTALAPLSDEDLQRGYNHYQPDEPGKEAGRPIIDWVAGNSFAHYEEHIPWMARAVGQGD